MAEAAAFQSLQLVHKPQTADVLDFYRQPEAASNIWARALTSSKLRTRKRYNRIVGVTYPNRLRYLGFYGATIYAIERFGAHTSLNQWMQANQSFLHTIVEKTISLVKQILPGTLFNALSHSLSKLWITKEVYRRMVFIIASWLGWSVLLRVILRAILSYERFIFENPRTGYSYRTKLWFLILKVFRGNPKLYSCQASLPNLPLPPIEKTCERWLESVRPLLKDEEYDECVHLAREFRDGLGPKCQRYLLFKKFVSTNWVTDWWEEFVYLTSRAPIMINSNFYVIAETSNLPSNNQCARAGNLCHSLFLWRQMLEREELHPQTAASVRPICMSQFERLFNTTRLPGESRDYIKHYEKSSHIVILHKNKYFKLQCFAAGGRRLLSPAELEDKFSLILQDKTDHQPGEETIAALTAGSRDKWYNARTKHFQDTVNATTLGEIESAAFVLCLDTDQYKSDITDPSCSEDMDKLAKSLFHGNCANRWFDKSFCLIVYADGLFGINGEHAWADAPVIGMTLEYMLWKDRMLGYDAAGRARGERTHVSESIKPVRLRFQLTQSCVTDIKESLVEARALADNLDLHLMNFTDFGKKRITKTYKCSPDAFVQLALQLAHFMDMGKQVLTYESAMTRLWRDGRTETVRSATSDAILFVKMMLDDTKTNEERLAQLRLASKKHVDMNLKAMVGQGVDRHLFGLYVVCSYMKQQSSFLKKVFSMTWGLSTSQTPIGQLVSLTGPQCENLCPGGGFGPVDPNGYGVSYLINSHSSDLINFHVSSQRSSAETDSKRFAGNIKKALQMVSGLFE